MAKIVSCWGVDAYKRGQLSVSLKNFTSAIQVCPEFNDSFSRFGSVFVEYNRESLKLFERSYATSKLVVVHVSCRPNLQLQNAPLLRLLIRR